MAEGESMALDATISNDQTNITQEINQRKLKHALENLLADELRVKPSNPSTLELLVSELRPKN